MLKAADAQMAKEIEDMTSGKYVYLQKFMYSNIIELVRIEKLRVV